MPAQHGHDALVAAETVGDQRVDDVPHMVHDPPVARSQCGDAQFVAQAGQAGEVPVEIPVGWPDHDRRAVHDVVTGEHESVFLDEPAQMVRGMARRVERGAE